MSEEVKIDWIRKGLHRDAITRLDLPDRTEQKIFSLIGRITDFFALGTTFVFDRDVN